MLSPVSNTSPARFGTTSLASSITGVTRGVDKTFGWMGANRTREMLVEDMGAFGVLRSGINLVRGYFYGNGQLNFVAAGERLVSEVGSIFTDNILGGIAASSLGKRLDKRWGSYSNGWTDYPTLELFKSIAQNSPDEQAFLANLAAQIAPDKQEAALETLKTAWNGISKQNRGEVTANLARAIGQDRFDIKINNEPFKLDTLLDDVGLLGQQSRKLSSKFPQKPWQTLTRDTLQSTLKAKNLKLACVGLGLAATFAFPFINAWNTKKLFGIDYYPGNIGLQEGRQATNAPQPTQQQARSQQNPAYSPFIAARQTPTEASKKNAGQQSYALESWRNGNRWPMLGALAPLVFASGLFDTVNRKFLNPFKPGFKNTLRKLFDFGKAWPFTTQQQMASAFAALITARLLCARSDQNPNLRGNEYRERLIDSGLGWGTWILATPFFKKQIGQWFDKSQGTRLLKEVNGQKVLRTRAEIENLLPYVKGVSREVAENTLKKHIWIGAGSTVATMVLLGIIEPVLGILWSKRNAAQAPRQTNTPPSMPNNFAKQPQNQAFV